MYIKIIKIIFGVALIVIGIIGLFLPVIPGILLIIAGLFVIEIKIKYLERWFKKLKF